MFPVVQQPTAARVARVAVCLTVLLVVVVDGATEHPRAKMLNEQAINAANNGDVRLARVACRCSRCDRGRVVGGAVEVAGR